MTQQIYGVFNRFRNQTPSAQPLTVGTERDVSYRRHDGGARAARIDDRRRRPPAMAGRLARRVPLPRQRAADLGRRLGAADAAGRLRHDPAAAASRPDDLARRPRRSLRHLRRDAGLAVDHARARPARPLPRSPAAAASTASRPTCSRPPTRSAIRCTPSARAISMSASASRSARGAGRRPSSIATRTTCCSSRTRRTRLIDGRPSDPIGPPL